MASGLCNFTEIGSASINHYDPALAPAPALSLVSLFDQAWRPCLAASFPGPETLASAALAVAAYDLELRGAPVVERLELSSWRLRVPAVVTMHAGRLEQPAGMA